MTFFNTYSFGNVLRVIKLTVVYFVAACAGIWFSFHDIQAAAILPASGVGLAMIYLSGREIWRAITLGSLFANVFLFYLLEGMLTWTGAFTSLMLAGVATIEVLLGHRLIQHFFHKRNLFQHAGEIFKFIGIAFTMGLAGATMGTILMGFMGNLQAPVLLTWLLWTMAEMVGILLFTPFILSWFQEFKFEWTRTLTMDIVVFLSFLAIMVIVSSVPYFSPIVWKSFPYLVVPLFLWWAFRFNLQLAISGILLVSLLSARGGFTGGGTAPME